MVWVKAADPRAGGSGTAVATMSLATACAEVFDIHLVCVGDTDETEAVPSGPFRTVRTVQVDHQRSLAHRVVFGAWYVLLQAAGIAPLAESIESCRSVRRAIAEVIDEQEAVVVLGEHWPMGPAVGACSNVFRIIRLLDVEHENITQRMQDSSLLGRLWLRWLRAAVRRSEVRAATAVDLALAVSVEDASMFGQLGVDLMHIPVSRELDALERHPIPGRLLFLGRLDWSPNIEGLDWFFRDAWPQLSALVPDVELRIVGGGDAGEIGNTWPEDRVNIVGWVDDLALELRRADVGVVPVHAGTGVKIKTIDLMAAGVPIVSTTSGSRGTAGASGGAVIADDASGFATSVAELVIDRDRNRSQSEAAVVAARELHGPEPARAFARQLLERVGHAS